MAIIKCKMCGGDLPLTEGMTVCECEYCGTRQTIPRFDNEKKLNLYDRANHFRRNNEFDKAEGIYEKILEEDATDAESYWSLVLCRYGIEYVEDPATHKRVPTVNRAQYTSIYSDENYKKALEYSDTLQKTIYEAEAKAIDEIQKGILEISSKEEPFDVFICYKETDDQGRRTRDSVYATELYHALTDEGFKVFFSRITLEDKLGTAYEPYIFAALNSAKVMVVLGTKPEHFNAVWVKNEWSRYLSLIQAGAKKTLIPAYRDMDPYDLPEEFSHLQSQDMSKLGFLQDLVRGIKKIIGEDQPAPQAAPQPVVVQGAGGVNLTAQIKRGMIALEDGDWDAADGFFDKALDLDAECAEAYFGKAMADAECASGEELVEDRLSVRGTDQQTLTACQKDTARIEKAAQTCFVPGYFSAEDVRGCFSFDERQYNSQTKAKTERLEEEKAFWDQDRMMSRAARYATGDFAKKLKALRAQVEAGLEQDLADSREKDAREKERVAAQYAERMERAEEAAKQKHESALKQRDQDYEANCRAQENAKTIEDFAIAAAMFENIQLRGYRDSDERARQCRAEEARLKAEEAERQAEEEQRRAEEERKAAEAKALAKKQAAEKRKKLFTKLGIAAAAVIVVAVVVAVVTQVIIPKQKLDRNAEILGEVFINASVGDVIQFGSYEQDNDISNGKETITWRVLAREKNQLLVISEYALDCQPYNSTETGVTWETCTLRAWLNDTFLNAAFTTEEQSFIPVEKIRADANPSYATNPGKATQDQVFLLSIPEANKYFSSDADRQCKPTAYADAEGCSVSDSGFCWWWLRSPGSDQYGAAVVSYDGSVYGRGGDVYYDFVAVRPALWIDLAS